MDTSEKAIQVRGGGSGGADRPKRRFRTVEEKRRIVEQTLLPGASVARVAQAHGVNANQVFGWRRLYQQGLLESKSEENTRLLPVRVVETSKAAAGTKGNKTQRTPSGFIHLEFPKGQLRIAGCVDTEALRVVLEKLLA